ncbi:hypothetical protein Leryth_006659 [Lithospermum erythrorhizon]|nr:hypothetical protein Leryth_006659 [Lithospermum erythrorhizon]
MEVEKRSSKGGFLQLFDWNLKSRKNLFSNNKSELSENGKYVKEYVDGVAISRIQQVHENGRVPEAKAITDLHYQAVPSDREEYGHEAKVPGVVARLMGLDYMPNSNSSDNNTLPFESQLFSRADYLRSLNFHDEHHIVIYESSQNSSNRVPKNPLDLKLHRMQRPIEKFQTDVPPSKTPKPVSISHNRQMSPIKSPGFIPPKNATFVMEAAARIIEQSPRSTAKGKSALLVSSSSTLRFQELSEKMGAAKKTSVMSDATSRQSHTKHVKRQPRDKGDVHLTSKVSTVALQNRKTKVKSAPLAVKAKSTVQRRDGMTSLRRISGNVKEASEAKPSYSIKNPPKSRKNIEKKTSSSTSSDVLRQNNQKQNYMTHMDEQSSKPSLSKRKDRKVLPTSDINKTNKVLNKVIVNPTARSGTTNPMVVNSRRDSSEFGIKKVSRKKLPENTNTYSVKSIENSTREKSVKSNVSSGGQNGLDVIDRKTGLDVVSFTFTSPINKLFPGSSSATQSTENNESSCLISGENDSSSKFSAASCSGTNEVGGDALSILLEQKLRELISNVEDPLQEVKETTFTSSNQCNSCTDGIRPSGPWDWQGSEASAEHTSFRKNALKRNFDLQNSSLPPSQNILDLEASCNSLDSYRSFTSAVSGSKWYSSSENDDVSDQSSTTASQITDVDLDLTDSACSSSAWSISIDETSSFTLSISKGPYNWELEYIKSIINYADLMLEDFALGHVDRVMDPNLFDHLESHVIESNKDLEEQFRVARRALFDCVEECLQSRCKRDFCGSFRAWSKWMVVFKRSDHLAEDLYREIFSLTNMVDLRVDEVVDKDMSSQGGRWVEFEYETFEEGIEIENEILTSLVNELLGDFVVSKTL